MNQAVKTGLITGAAASASWLASRYLPDGTLVFIFNSAAVLIFLAGTYIAVKRRRDSETDEDPFDFKKGLRTGVSAGTVAALIIGIMQYIYFNNMDVHAYLASLVAKGQSQQQLLAELDNLNKTNFYRAAMMVTAANIVISFFISIMASLTLRKKGGLLNQQ